MLIGFLNALLKKRQSMNNWQRYKYQSKEEAVLTAIALVVKSQDCEVSWNNQLWTRDSFSKEFLKKVEVKV